jgi:hypothetical protein
MRAALLHTLLLVALPAAAQESLDEIDKAKGEAPAGDASSMGEAAKSSIAVVNGYLSNRFSYTYVDPYIGPLATDNLPSLSDLLEANVQLKVNIGKTMFAYGDVSLVLQGAWLYYGDGRMELAYHDNDAYKPLVATNELYASWSPAPWLNLLAGKKRIVWGSGFAFNPTDLVNPPKDPTDPNFQRAGAWLARVELPFEKFTISALAAPSVLYSSNGLPYQVLLYPDYHKTDNDLHYLLAARLYTLFYNADISLMAFWTNQYNDAFKNELRLGFSFSRYFFTDYELHIDALVQRGSPRAFPNHACVTSPFSTNCPNPATDAIANSRLESNTFYPRILVGTRYMFKDESLLSIEYYYQSDGYSDLEFEDVIRGLNIARQRGLNTGMTGSMNGAVPGKFTFDPLRRHYLILSYSKPRIKDDWTASLTTIVGLTDLSGMITPSVSWNTLEWLTLSLSAFIPVRGIPVNEVTVDGKSYSEYSLLPFDVRVLFEARAFY